MNLTPLCPALLNGHAASMSSAPGTPAECMATIIEASSCLGSRCAKWVPEDDRGSGVPLDGGYVVNPTGRGWCSDNLNRAPFADPAVPTTTEPK